MQALHGSSILPSSTVQYLQIVVRLIMDEVRICTKCGQTKPLAAYYRSGSYPRGDCKVCTRADNKARPRTGGIYTGKCVDCGKTIHCSNTRCAVCFRSQPPKWRMDKYGYMICTRGGKTLAQHREMMAEFLGRPLYKGETVHHKNGVRHDNKISNLELWVSFQPSGQRVQDLLDWANEIIGRYGPLNSTKGSNCLPSNMTHDNRVST